MTFQVELVSPESISYSGEAEMVIARTLEGGDIAFQPGHVPFIGVLAVWSVDVIRSDGARDTIAVHQGFIQVAGTKVSILSDVSESAGDIDVARAEEARSSAEQALASARDAEAAAGAVARAELRLRVASAELSASGGSNLSSVCSWIDGRISRPGRTPQVCPTHGGRRSSAPCGTWTASPVTVCGPRPMCSARP